MASDHKTILKCRELTVRFGEVTALQDVDVSLEVNRIHAVVGQNGAGKTTFARVVAGLVRPDKGDVWMDGSAITPGNVAASRLSGIELVHQSFALPPSFTVAEAMQFGADGGGLYSRSALERRWQSHLDKLDIQVKAGQRIRDLPIESQQAVEIARALVSDAKLLILDEPTAVLSPEGAARLFDQARHLRDRGVTVVLILHKIREVLAVAETVTVLRGGLRVAGPLETAQIDSERLSDLIIGSASDEFDEEDRAALTGAAAPAHLHAAEASEGTPVLEMKNVSTRQDSGGPRLDSINLLIQPGEIVGIAGVEGNGQRTLVRTIAGLSHISEGTVSLDGSDLTYESLADRRATGLRIIPFERNVEGLSLNSPLWENWSALGLLRKPLFAMISPGGFRRDCVGALDSWNVVYADVNQRAGSLSGGNAQKLILSREIDETARLVIAAQPTRGLDIGATAFVWDSLRKARARGCGVLFISSDLDEIFDISDRIAVMVSGHIQAIFEPPFEIGRVGATMTGTVQ